MLIEDVERIIRTAPGLTATQIARKLYGSNGYGERVRALCQALHKLGRIERIGMGGPGEPFRFYPATDGAASSSLPGKATACSFAELSQDNLPPPELGNLGRPPIGSVVE